ncbi:MAG: class II fructose-bisphosphatase [Candidatus Eremiobacter antarcticus]|nr:class II fructose-bisphosphatase [Candidatus Eremiobacteraeota bacterium]MBC5808907.1 class II fructose-bisphosphatase [Candidatus Eremiobacteraeota bacterium]PZR60408.1 MAG: class II fructose-bisphosphatase [Candidatus Eremiobacter sp. RRmetagenome_bin22]
MDTLDFVKVTEAAALAASRWMGKGERDKADGAAVEKMRATLNDMDIRGRVVIGEGERDEAPMLFIGEELGKGGVEVDIAVDPVEGTNLVANGLPNSIAVLAVTSKGGLLNAPDTYMEKLAVGPKAAEVVHIDASVSENLELVANALERSVGDITVVILDRPRHKRLIEDVRAAGAKIRLISDGDVDAAIATAIDGTGIHVAMGTGGAPEGVLAAAALRCLGGGFMGRLKPRNEEEAKRALDMGFDDVNKVLKMEDLVKKDDITFVATGITDGDLVRGVRFFGNGARTHSIIMNSRSSTVRFVETVHRFRAGAFRVRQH